MDKRLNTELTKAEMERAGFSQKAVADKLEVSREAVSQWLKHKSFPRPDKLLKLGQLLSLSYDQLVTKDQDSMPQIAFRKMKGTKTKDHHVEKAQEMGLMLRQIVPYLPIDCLSVPPVLKEPSADYSYLQHVASMVREEIHVDETSTIDFNHLIRRFRELQAVLVPVLWGAKKEHKNAAHIYLPDSQTTWVYLNLDVNSHDFKFWMAHELGHCMSPSLRGNEAEDFADAFAGALLFPSTQAENGYKVVTRARSEKGQLQRIVEIAERAVISPYTVYLQINAYAKNSGKQMLSHEPAIFKWTTNLNRKYCNLSDVLFRSSEPPAANEYISVVEEAFETPFFESLGTYLREHQKGPGLVQTVMDIPLSDARSLHAELT